MLLQEFPKAIADTRRKILNHDTKIVDLAESVLHIECAVDKVVLFDPELKNEAQRKLKRTELLNADEQYQRAVKVLKDAKEERELLNIELEQLRNQFSVYKIQQRESIAMLEANLAS